MATRYAIKNGNWSDVATWDGEAAVPESGDTVVAGGYTVTIDQNITVVQIRTLASGSGASAGKFTTAVSRTVTANVLAGTTPCLEFTGASGQTLTVNGTVTGSAATANGWGISMTDTGTVVVVAGAGSVFGGAIAAHGINNAAAGTVTITSGNVTGGIAVNACGINNASTGTVTITSGNVTGGSSGCGPTQTGRTQSK